MINADPATKKRYTDEVSETLQLEAQNKKLKAENDRKKLQLEQKKLELEAKKLELELAAASGQLLPPLPNGEEL